MKLSLPRNLVYGVGLLALGAAPVHAELIYYGSFDDLPGTNPPTGWEVTSEDNPSAGVTAGSLDYPNLFTSDNKWEISSSRGTMKLNFADTGLQAGETMFFSFLMNVNDASNLGAGTHASILDFRVDGGVGHDAVAGIGFGKLDGDAENEYRLSVDGDFRGYARPEEAIRVGQVFTEGETLMIVGSFARTGGQNVNFWINPDVSTFGDLAAPAAHFSDGGDDAIAVSTLYFESGSANTSFANWNFDEFRVGTTWADVTPVPEPSTYALLAGCGVIVFAILRRRKKAA